MDDRLVIHSKTTLPLDATIDNMNVSVKLIGKDLHGNGNNCHFSRTRFKLEAEFKNGKIIPVTIVPHSAHESIQELRDRGEIAAPRNGLGHLEMFTEEDYKVDDQIIFSSIDLGRIDIGRYGPFLKSGKL